MAQAPERFVRLDADHEREAVWSQIEQALEQHSWW
jgi:thymidylate kinase